MKIIRLSKVAIYVLALLKIHSLANDDVSRLDNVVVTATKTPHTLGDVPADTVLITKDDIEKSHAKTISELLNEIPGFNFSQQSDLASAMGYKNTIRGLNVESRYMLVLVDGQRIFTGYHSGGMASAGFSHSVNVVPVSMIERIEVVKGPASALYGSDAITGVLNIITKKTSDTFEANAGVTYGVYRVAGTDYAGNKAQETNRERKNAYLSISGPFSEKIKAGLHLNREENDGIDYIKSDIDKSYVNANIEFTPNDYIRTNIGAEYIKYNYENKTIVDKKIESSKRFYGSLDYEITKDQIINFNAYYQNLNANFKTRDYGNQKADVSYEVANLQYSNYVLENQAITVGVEYMLESLDTNLVSDKEISTKSFYAQDEIYFFDDVLVFVPGFRYDKNSDYGDELNPKLNILYNITNSTKIKALVGTSFKAPNAFDTSTKPILHNAFWSFSNPDLKPEKSLTYQLSLEQAFLNNALLMTTTYYHTNVKDKISKLSTGETHKGLPIIKSINIDEVMIDGFEFALRYNFYENFGFNLAYAYTNAKNKKTKETLVDVPKNSLSASVDYENKGFDFGGMLSLDYTSKQRNSIFLPTMENHTDEFTTVGLSVWKGFAKKGKIKLDVNNIFNQELKNSSSIVASRSIMLNLEYIF